MSFVRRRLQFTFILNQGTFTESGTDTLIVSDLRASVHISKAGGISAGEAELKVHGMTLSTMNQVSTLGMRSQYVPKNQVIVAAGDEDGVLTTVFVGNMIDAYIDFTNMPDVALHAHAAAGLTASVAKAAPASYDGPTDVADIIANLAGLLGVPFVNNGVSVIIDHPYFHGSARKQILDALEAAHTVEWNSLDDGTVTIWPKGQSRGGEVPLVSPGTGLIGYPTYNAFGIIFRTLFNPSIGFGGTVQVESSLTRASGSWNIYRLDHELEALTPNGQWSSTVYAYQPAFGPAPLS